MQRAYHHICGGLCGHDLHLLADRGGIGAADFGAAKYDYVCEKSHGCLPLPVTNEQIIGMHGNDPRYVAN